MYDATFQLSWDTSGVVHSLVKIFRILEEQQKEKNLISTGTYCTQSPSFIFENLPPAV